MKGRAPFAIFYDTGAIQKYMVQLVQLSYTWCNWCNYRNAMPYQYAERESKSLEFKSTLPKFYQLAKTCVAFANGIGGKIIIGVDDETREVIGIDDEVRNRIYDEFPNSLYDTTSPGLLAEIYEQAFNEKSVMIIEIASSNKKPVCIKKDGIPGGVYLRAGSSTRKATSEYIEELMRENQRMNFDEEPIQANEYTDILSLNLLENTFGKIDCEKLVSEKIIARSNTSIKKYYPTITGVLYFSHHPEKYIPEALIRCTRFGGIEGRDIIQSEEICGTLEHQIDVCFKLVRSWLMRDYHVLDARLRAMVLIPEVALREAIINAVVHRKYWIPGAIKIALYEDRLEIFSPGNFPGLMGPHHLGDGTTYLRNPHIARMARRLGLVEKLGTGIRLMFESCKKANLQPPEFQENADSIKVIFPFLFIPQSSVSEQENLLALFTMLHEVRLKEVETYLNISRNTATRKLNQLIELGKIQRHGKGPSVKYILKTSI